MGLFDKKFCDICGNKISLLGNKKLADGNMCGTCEKKLSNWFHERKASTLAEIKEQLAYREANEAALANFHATREIGPAENKFFLVDEANKKFIILREGEDRKKNPDIFEIAKVKDATMRIVEDKSEVRYKNAEGSMVSYSPKHYSYKYRFNITITYDGPYFDTLKFPLNYTPVDGGADDENYMGEESFDAALKRDLTNQFFEKVGVNNAVPAPGQLRHGVQMPGQPAYMEQRVENRGRMHSLPGGYREDGMTTMGAANIQRYKEFEAMGNEIIAIVLQRESAPVNGLSMEKAIMRENAMPQDDITAENVAGMIEGMAASKTAELQEKAQAAMEAARNGAAMQGMAAMAGMAAGNGMVVPENAGMAAPAGWTCGCGTVNTGKFCMGCGAPAPKPAEDGSWTCGCGTVNTGKFCMGCGAPAPKPAEDGSWTCGCGTVNTGKFCMNCGSPRP